MKKEKWLLNEIDRWEQDKLISAETSAVLKDLYVPKKNINLLVAVFSVIGAVLIGAGIILILAKNWGALPFLFRVTLAFLPLLISQALAVYTVKRKYESIAWRESVAILVTASVFAAVAMVGQVFHLPGDYGTYVLTCGLLSLPMIYILDAAAPLIVYYWTVLNWAALDQSDVGVLLLIGFLAAGAIFVFMNRKREGVRLYYMTWLTLIAGFVASLILGAILESSLLLMSLCYFTLLLSIEELPDSLTIPFKVIGLIGSLITFAILTYEEMWAYLSESMTVGASALAGAMLVAALFFAVRAFRHDRLRFSFLFALIFICVARYFWAVLELDASPYDLLFMMLTNLMLLAIGVGFMVHGVKHTSLLTTNIGMVIVCALIVMRFFDSNMDFFWRGIVFLALGTAFLLVNLKILRKRKQPKQEAGQ